MADWIVNITYLSPGIPLLVGLVRFRGTHVPGKLITLFIASSVIMSILHVIGKKYGWPLGALSSISSLIEFFFSLVIFRYALGRFIPQAIYYLAFSGFMLMFAYQLFLSPIFFPVSPYLFLTYQGIATIGLCLLYFLKLAKELQIMHLEQTTMFWFASASLLYFCAGLTFFLLNSYIAQLSKELITILVISLYQVPIIAVNLIIAIGLWQKQPG